MNQTINPNAYRVLFKSGKTCDNCNKKGYRLYSFGGDTHKMAYDVLCPDCMKKALRLSRTNGQVDSRLLRNAQKVNPVVIEMTNEVYDYVNSVKRLVVAVIQFGNSSYRDSIIQLLHNGDAGITQVAMTLFNFLDSTNKEINLLISSDKQDLRKFVPKQTFQINQGYSKVYIGGKQYTQEAYIEFLKAFADELKVVRDSVISTSPGGLLVLCPSCGSYLKQSSVIRQNDNGDKYARYVCKKAGCKKCTNKVEHLVFSMTSIKYY